MTSQVFATPEGSVISILFDYDKKPWVSEEEMSLLFKQDLPTIKQHLTEVLEAGELEAKGCLDVLRFVGEDLEPRYLKHYSLEVVTRVGDRVDQEMASRFQDWALSQASSLAS